MAFSKELEAIIEAALADGVITEKERAVLHKKALLEGVDPDEVDVVIDGRLQQIQKSIDDAKQKVRKCPSCGEIIPAMTAVCPSCGQVIDASNADNKALAVYMDKLEASLVKLKENGASKYNNKVKAELESMIRQGRAMYGENKKINYLISEVEASIAKFDKAHRNRIILVIVGLIIALAIVLLGVVKCSQEVARQAEVDRIEAAKQAEANGILLMKGEAQRDSLCALLNNLPTPTTSNYKNIETRLAAITWDDIYCEDKDTNQRINGGKYSYWSLDCDSFKKTFILKKIAIAEQIYSIYKEIYTGKRTDGYAGSKADQIAPKWIQSAEYEIKN